MVLGDVGVLPFFEVLDWDRASVRVWPYDLDHITERLRGIPQQMVAEMKEQVCMEKGLSLGLHPVVVFCLLTSLGIFPGIPPQCNSTCY